MNIHRTLKRYWTILFQGHIYNFCYTEARGYAKHCNLGGSGGITVLSDAQNRMSKSLCKPTLCTIPPTTNKPDKAATTWIVAVAVNGKQFPLKLDTRAEVTVILEDSLQLLTRRELQTERLRGPDNRPLKVVGEFTMSLAYKDHVSEQTVYVIKELHQNLLGLPTMQSLGILE